MELSRWYHHRFPWLLSAAPDGAGEPPPGSHGTKRLPPPRRARSCPKTVRRPVSSWPRSRGNRAKSGSVTHSVGEIYAWIPKRH